MNYAKVSDETGLNWCVNLDLPSVLEYRIDMFQNTQVFFTKNVKYIPLLSDFTGFQHTNVLDKVR